MRRHNGNRSRPCSFDRYLSNSRAGRSTNRMTRYRATSSYWRISTGVLNRRWTCNPSYYTEKRSGLSSTHSRSNNRIGSRHRCSNDDNACYARVYSNRSPGT